MLLPSLKMSLILKVSLACSLKAIQSTLRFKSFVIVFVSLFTGTSLVYSAAPDAIRKKDGLNPNDFLSGMIT